MTDAITVHTLISCPTAEAVHCGIPLFHTLRVGFPSASVRIWDNQSCSEAAPEIARRAREIDGELRRLTYTLRGYAFLSDVVMNPEHTGTTVILDSNVRFWSSCEEWTFDALLAGRLIPSFLDEASGCINLPRLHPSFWWIPDVGALRERIVREYRASAVQQLDAFLPYIFRDLVSSAWYRFDTGANLYAALKESTQRFGAVQLDCFDCPLTVSDGTTSIPALDDRHGPPPAGVRGLWRAQDEYFRTRAVPSVAELVFGR
jgi:hypothetical protein